MIIHEELAHAYTSSFRSAVNPVPGFSSEETVRVKPGSITGSYFHKVLSLFFDRWVTEAREIKVPCLAFKILHNLRALVRFIIIRLAIWVLSDQGKGFKVGAQISWLLVGTDFAHNHIVNSFGAVMAGILGLSDKAD